MKLKLLFSTLLIFFLFQTTVSAQFDATNLIEYSKNFIKTQKLNTNLIPDNVKILTDKKVIYGYVVNLKPKGFIVFSPSKQLFPIISFSEESNFNFKNSKENTLLHMIKKDMTNELQILDKKLNRKQRKLASKNTNDWNKLISIKNQNYSAKAATLIQYGPLLTSVWGGVNCHDTNHNNINVGNYYTPNNYSPGCVATSLSIIMHYYKWPETGVGSHTNYDNYGSSQTSWTANFGAATYDYDNMLDVYHHASSNLTEQKAMGYISFHTATALDMDYESTGSTSNINRIPAAAGNYFRYSSHHQNTNWSSFWSRMQENIENEHPVAIAIDATNGAGHAPVVDGYRYNEGDAQTEYYYHLNMGWYGSSNAWYRLRSTFSAGGYTSVSAAVFDLLPEPAFTESSLEATSKTFTLNWTTSSQINWDAFELQESTNGGSSYTTIDNNINATNYSRTVTTGGNYKYRVRSKVNGNFYSNSYSETISVTVPYDYTYLDFDGNDSFFVYDNTNNDFDVSNTYTIETWIKIDNRASGTYPVILDRKTVFSLYLIADSNADYAVKFVSRNSSGTINASVQSNSSSENLNYNEWVHLAVSRSNGHLKLFVNGTQVANSSDNDFNLSSSANALNIGARYWGSYSRYLNGKIDKIRITDNAIYTGSFTPNRNEQYTTTANTRILLALDEGTGTSLQDDATNFVTIQLRTSPNQPNWMFSDDTGSARTSTKNEISKKLVEINLYPNPATTGITKIITVSNTQKGILFIYDYLGRIVIQKEIELSKGTNKLETDINKLQTGFYQLAIKTNTHSYTSKFIKN